MGPSAHIAESMIGQGLQTTGNGGREVSSFQVEAAGQYCERIWRVSRQQGVFPHAGSINSLLPGIAMLLILQHQELALLSKGPESRTIPLES